MSRIIVPLVQIPTKKRKKTIAWLAHASMHTCCTNYIDSFVTIRIDGIAQLISNYGSCLIPGNTFEFSFATLANTLHWILKTVWMIKPTTHTTATKAGARLQVFIARIVCFHVLDFAILYMPLKYTVACAVYITLAPCNSFW